MVVAIDTIDDNQLSYDKIINSGMCMCQARMSASTGRRTH